MKLIDRLIDKDPTLLSVTNSHTGFDVLELSIYLGRYDSFKRLIDLGADVNSINPITQKSKLISACKYYYDPEPYTIESKYLKVLLEKGADPNYVIENNVKDKRGVGRGLATSPLMSAAELDLELVKLLLKHGANPHKKLKEGSRSLLSATLNGNKNRIQIASYLIDSLNINPSDTLAYILRKPGNKWRAFYIQDYLVNHFIWAKLTNDTISINELKNRNPKIEVANKEALKFVKKLQELGIDFINYKYVRDDFKKVNKSM